MCEHRLTDLFWTVVVIVVGALFFNGISHWPKTMTNTVEKCSKPLSQAENEINFMTTAKDVCYDRGGLQNFKMIKADDATYHPEFNCKKE